MSSEASDAAVYGNGPVIGRAQASLSARPTGTGFIAAQVAPSDILKRWLDRQEPKRYRIARKKGRR